MDLNTSVWSLSVKEDKHNHEPAQNLEGHPYAMRLNAEEKDIVLDMSKENAAPVDILAKIKRKNPKNVSSLRTVYNERKNIHV